MSVIVVGAGLVTALGLSVRDHAFFWGPSAVRPRRSPFVDEAGERIDVRRAPWFSLDLARSARLLALVGPALSEALGPLGGKLGAGAIGYLVVPRGQDDDELRLEIEAIAGAPFEVLRGAAGVFAAVAAAEAAFTKGRADTACIVAVDSWIEADRVASLPKPSPWHGVAPPPGEGAAALVVCSPGRAASAGLGELATLLGANCQFGAGTDADDAAPDGRAMTAVLGALPEAGQVRSVFGQLEVDDLREDEWSFALARTAARFHPEHAAVSIEKETGMLGAAAGAASIVFAVGGALHGTCSAPPTAPWVAWAISEDGTRGATIGRGSQTTSDVFRPSGGAPTRRPLPARSPRLPETPPPSALATDVEAFLTEMAAANDDPLYEGEGPRPPVSLAAAEVVSETAYYADVAADALDTVSALGRDRFEGPRARVADNERRILAALDAIAATGPGAISSIQAFAELGASAPNPFSKWASVLALASIADEEALSALGACLAGLAPAQTAHVFLAAEAITLVAKPEDTEALEQAFSRAAPSVAAALRIDMRSRREALSDNEVRTALSSDSPLVAEAALRALDRLPNAWPAAHAAVRALLDHPSSGVVRRAARALVLAGDTHPLADLRHGGPLAERLGPSAIDLFVLAGTGEDLIVLDRLLDRLPISREVLSAVARFGHARSFSFLAHFLGDPALAADAATALETLFGARVTPAERAEPGAWRRAIRDLAPDPAVRLRRGEPWSPETLAAEIAGGTLSRPALAAALDELACRVLGPRDRDALRSVDLGAWGAEPAARTAEIVQRAVAAFAADRAGRWT